MVHLLITMVLFISGASLGSFLNVVILRYLQHRTPLGRSACLHCGHTLSWWELVPLLSYLWLRGRCFQCRQQISIQYPVVEFAMGLAVVILTTPLPQSLLEVLQTITTIALVSTLLVLLVIDARSLLLPDFFIVTLALIVILQYLIVFELGTPFTQPGQASSTPDALLGLLIGAGFLATLWIITRGQGIGLGDVKLLIPLGVLLGLTGTITLLFFSFLLGGTYGSWLLIRGKVNMKTAVPFGPYLTGVAIIVLLFPALPTQFSHLLLG